MMSNSPTPQEGDEQEHSAEGGEQPVDEVIEDELQRIHEHERDMELLLDAHRHGARIAYRSALDIETQNLLEVVAAGEGSAEISRRLAQRHNELCIGRSFTEAILSWRVSSSDAERERCLEELERLRREGREHGFFIMEYTEDQMLRRLLAPPQRYLITEASGRHPASEHPHHWAPAWSADCHVAIPEAVHRAKHVLELPRKGDIVHDKGLVRAMRRRPYSVAIIEDLSCAREMDHLCLAAAARGRALHTLENDVNPQRIKDGIDCRLKYVAAAIASLQGVLLPTGKRLMLREHLGIGPVGNERSKFIFENCRNYSFHTAYELVNREHPVVLPSDDPQHPHKIIATWWMMVARLNVPEAQGSL